MSKQRVTSIDVARLAGVSQSAVSRSFSREESVAPETREKVFAAARQLGYEPNMVARSMSTQRTNVIGIVMANLPNPFYPMVLDRLVKSLQAHDQRVLLHTFASDNNVDDELPAIMRYQVDGLILTSATLSSAMADACARRGTPVVLFNRYALGASASAVCCDAIAGGRMVADLLVDCGHQRIAFMAGKANTSTNTDRERGFSERLKERGVEIYLRDAGDFEYEGGYQAAFRLLQRDEIPDAVFCANDLMAMATLDVARRELGLRVPEELAVVGFDDISMAAWPPYKLTTITQPVDQLVHSTVTVLMQQIEQAGMDRVFRFIPPTLTLRATTRPLPGDLF